MTSLQFNESVNDFRNCRLNPCEAYASFKCDKFCSIFTINQQRKFTVKKSENFDLNCKVQKPNFEELALITT